VEPDCLWVGIEVPCSEVDKQLFRLSTFVIIRFGRTACFWESSWLDGRAPRDLAPSLFKLAWRKNNTDRDDLHNGNWMRGAVADVYGGRDG
jgi:hypothetical protein